MKSKTVYLEVIVFLVAGIIILPSFAPSVSSAMANVDKITVPLPPHNKKTYQAAGMAQTPSQKTLARLFKEVGNARAERSYQCVVRVDGQFVGTFSQETPDSVKVEVQVDFSVEPGTDKQVWPSTFYMRIGHKSGASWTIAIPAKSARCEKFSRSPWKYDRAWPEKRPGEKDGDRAVDILEDYMSKVEGQEQDYAMFLKKRGRLCHFAIEIPANNLRQCDTFLQNCTPHALEFQNLVRGLSSLPGNIVVTFDMVFSLEGPAVGRNNMGSLTRAFENFRNAVVQERNEPKYFDDIWALNLQAARAAGKGSWKAIDAPLPVFIPKIPSLYCDIMEYIKLHGLDLHLQSQVHKAIHAALAETPLYMHPLAIVGGESTTYGALVEIPAGLEVSSLLSPGTSGRLQWMDSTRGLPEWRFIVPPPQGIGNVTDVFLTIFPLPRKNAMGQIATDPQRPEAIDLGEAKTKGILEAMLESREVAQMVQLRVHASDTTENQRWAALSWLNSDLNKNRHDIFAEGVARILTGQNLVDIGAGRAGVASCFEDFFTQKKAESIGRLQAVFAKAIALPNAKISAEQENFIFDCPSKAPFDRLMIGNGFAGSSKSTCIALWLSLMHWNGESAKKTTRGLVLAKMHKTVNISVESLTPIVMAATGKHVVREYSDKFDLRMLEWIVDNCPEQYRSAWSKDPKESEEEYRDVLELAKAMYDSLKLTSGNLSKHFAMHEATVIWQIVQYTGRFMPNLIPDKIIRSARYSWMARMQPAQEQQPVQEQQLMRKEQLTMSDGAQEYQDPKSNSKKRARNSNAEEKGGPRPPKKRQAPPAKAELTKEERVALEGIVERDMKTCEIGKEHRDWVTLIVLLREKLTKGTWPKAKSNEAMTLLKRVKAAWMEAKVAVVCTTISLASGGEMKRWNPTHGVLDEAQYVDNHDSAIVLRTLAGKPVYFVGDVHQLSPFSAAKVYIPTTNVHAVSLFEKEINRGRPHAVLSESRRCDNIGLGMASELCYGNFKTLPDSVNANINDLGTQIPKI